MQKTSSYLRTGFSLIEVLVSFAVLALIMVMLLSITDVTSKTWKGTTEKMQAFEESRAAFDRITSLLGQATLTPYWDYDDPQNPTKYQRASELQFLSLPMALMPTMPPTAAAVPAHGLFFQAATGKVASTAGFGNLPLLLNAYGYFVEYGPDERPVWLPDSIAPRNRFRLKEWRAPSEKMTLYGKTSGPTGKVYHGADWINLSDPAAKALAENVIAFVVYPKSTDSTPSSLAEPDTFVYNTRTDSTTAEGKNQKHQLPPEVELVMVAVDETSALRQWNNASSSPALAAGLFERPANLEADLKTLISRLNTANIKFIILRSTVKIRGARWSQSQ